VSGPAPRPRPRPRAVLFDLFHTLVQVQPSPDTRQHTWHDLGVTQDEWYRVLFEDRPGRALGRVRDPVEGMRMLVDGIDPSIPHERVARAALRRVERFDRTLESVPETTTAAVARLRAAGFRIALVSNAGWDEIGAWPRSPLAPHFDATVFSCDVGVVKPDPAIYEHALRRVGVAADEAVFVGDGASDEHRGARALGLRTVLVTRLGSLTPERVAERRAHADEVHDDVETFAERLLGANGR